jgi:hypothetical protein
MENGVLIRKAAVDRLLQEDHSYILGECRMGLQAAHCTVHTACTLRDNDCVLATLCVFKNVCTSIWLFSLCRSRPSVQGATDTADSIKLAVQYK